MNLPCRSTRGDFCHPVSMTRAVPHRERMGCIGVEQPSSTSNPLRWCRAEHVARKSRPSHNDNEARPRSGRPRPRCPRRTATGRSRTKRPRRQRHAPSFRTRRSVRLTGRRLLRPGSRPHHFSALPRPRTRAGLGRATTSCRRAHHGTQATAAAERHRARPHRKELPLARTPGKRILIL